MEIEVYYKKSEAKGTTVTVTPTRVTIKVSRTVIGIPLEAFEVLAEKIAQETLVENSFRGNMHFKEGQLRSTTQAYDNLRKLSFTIRYDFEDEYFEVSGFTKHEVKRDGIGLYLRGQTVLFEGAMGTIIQMAKWRHVNPSHKSDKVAYLVESDSWHRRKWITETSIVLVENE